MPYNERLVQEQAPPQQTQGDIWLLVLQDMEARRQMGITKYGMPVQVNSGRDRLVDAYQEALDLCVYLRAEIEERVQSKLQVPATPQHSRRCGTEFRGCAPECTFHKETT